MAERADIDRHRARLLDTRERLRGELARIEAGLADLDDRQRLLDRLVTPAPPTELPATHAVGRDGEIPPATYEGPALRGPAIRAAAVRVLAAHPGREALHYREWYELLLAKGFHVAGKDPLAVFLTQLNRSPLVRKGTQAGVYALDLDAPARLRARLDELQVQLRLLISMPASTADLGSIRERRGLVNAEIGQVEKALEEASRVLSVPEPSLAAVAAG